MSNNKTHISVCCEVMIISNNSNMNFYCDFLYHFMLLHLKFFGCLDCDCCLDIQYRYMNKFITV